MTDEGDDAGPDPGLRPPARVRPYVITGGRIPSPSDLPPEAVVRTCSTTPPRSLTAEESAAVRLCVDPTSIAELAAALGLPLGVATVIVSDLLDAGLLEADELFDADDQALIRKLIHGIEAL